MLLIKGNSRATEDRDRPELNQSSWEHEQGFAKKAVNKLNF